MFNNFALNYYYLNFDIIALTINFNQICYLIQTYFKDIIYNIILQLHNFNIIFCF